MPEVWERDLWAHEPGCAVRRGKMPASCFCHSKTAVTRTLTYDERENTTLTRAEVEGLLRLANYEKRTP